MAAKDSMRAILTATAVVSAVQFIATSAGATDYSVCVAQSHDRCGWGVDVFISCPTKRLTNEDIARSLCLITDANGKKTVGRYRIVPISDVHDSQCGVSRLEISCLDD